MTTIPVTDIANEYTITIFSEDGYPSNKNYEITSGQLSILKAVNERLLSASIREEEDVADAVSAADGYVPDASGVIISEVETAIDTEALSFSVPTIQTPSLSAVYDKEKRIRLLEDEVVELRKQKLAKSSDKLTNFTNILFNKHPTRAGSVNKRVVIVNYAAMNQVPLGMEDLEECSDEEIDSMYVAIKHYHEVHKKKIVVTNFIIILIGILEQVLLKLGFDDIKGLSAEVTSDLVDVEIGDDCEQIATRLGISNNPVLNIALFIAKIFIRRIRIL
ncbi:viral membrane formation [Eastern grey kangaroopox virus]|uniref:Viral membrane formation n=1 Tax=Eastern grey kangaroopox virus TaxID=2042482 RepID=A0A2C9DT78_9POXV|nr:viral membrane formation [Eastern grey kangaroopox virus]ATI21211.1 viral membrane formation [Eastern grey kangaroopox virus]ATX75118.1 viral membrane formation [Eastern grey kangaroopox virus]